MSAVCDGHGAQHVMHFVGAVQMREGKKGMKHVELSTGCHDCHTHCGQLCKALELLGMLTRCSQLTIGPSSSPSQGPANTKLFQSTHGTKAVDFNGVV